MARFLILFMALALSASAEWSNPLIDQRADPQIHLHSDGWYYFTATVPKYDRIDLRRAKTIEGLAKAKPKVVWMKHPTGVMGAHIWAPELHHIDGKWYIHFAAGKAEDIWHIRMYVLENASPNPMLGEWIEMGEIKTKWDSFSLDATTFEHRGQRYLVWAQNDPSNVGHGTDLYIAAMENPWTIRQPQVMLTRAEHPWETVGHHVNEGPAVIKHGDRIFLSYSASATDHNYCLGLLWADTSTNLLDPASWSKSPTPVFVSSRPNSQYGPGHNSFTTTPDGKTDLIVYHARHYREIKGDPLANPDRHSRVQVLRWREDGFPDFGEPVKDGPLDPR